MRRTEASPDPATVRGLPRCERPRLKKRAAEGPRVATMNVGTLTGRGREVVELMKMRRVSILLSRKPDGRGTNRRNWVRDTSYTVMQLQRMGEMAWAS